MIRRPRTVLTLLTLLNLLNYLDRYVLSAVVSPLQSELHLSNFVAGMLPSVFLIGYFAASPIFGYLGDRGAGGGTRATPSRNGLLAAGVAVWSVATVASGLARSVGALVGSRAVVGVGEASFATVAPSIIDNVAPLARKSRWMAIFCAATPIGSALGYLVGGAVLHSLGWRSAFWVAGAPGLVASLFCLFIADETTGGSIRHEAGGGVRAVATLGRIALYRNSVLGYCAYTFAIGGFGYWAPKFLHDRYALNPGAASVDFGMLTVVGGAAGTLLGGFLADRAVRQDLRGRAGPLGAAPPLEPGADRAIARANIRVCAGACMVGAPLAFAAISAPTVAGFFAFALPCQVALFVLSGPINIAVLRSAPAPLRASAMALCIFAIHACGDLWSNPIIGLVADHASIQTAMYAVPAAFAVAAFVWWRTT